MKPQTKQTKVIFFRMNTNQAKIHFICSQIKKTLEQEKKLLIFTPNQEAANYIDALLWRLPEESFIPHAIVHSSTKEWVAITTQFNQNFNQAPYLLNLSLQNCPIYQEFEEIYELYDETNEQRRDHSHQRWTDYQSKNVNLILQT